MGVTVMLVWIKAQVGSLGNETADALAKEGAEGQQDPVAVGTPFIEVKNELRQGFV